MDVKNALYAHCLKQLRQRMETIREEISKIQSAANLETKSSVGDKYETGRAMAQQEIELNTRQLSENEALEATMISMTLHTTSDRVTHGSLVTTSSGIFFIAISIGKVELDNNLYYVVSPGSPVGKLLMGKRAGEGFLWNGTTDTIISVD